MDTATTIARGGEPYWQDTFPHPTYGDLTFKVERTLKNRDWLDHAVVQEQLGPGLSNSMNSMLAAAIAGMQTFILCPTIDEKRETDPDNPDHVKVTLIKYDPLEDDRLEFPIIVWTRFMNWRAQSLSDATKEAVKNSSGATTGAESADSSPVTTASPQAA